MVKLYSKESVATIFAAQEQGSYSDVKVLSEETFIINGKDISKQTLSYHHTGVVSEFNGELLKARLTFKNTPRNRKRTESKEFVSEVFKQIMQYQNTKRAV